MGERDFARFDIQSDILHMDLTAHSACHLAVNSAGNVNMCAFISMAELNSIDCYANMQQT